MLSTYLIQVLLLVCLFIFVRFVLPLIKEHRVQYWIKLAIRTAEDRFNLPRSGEDKRKFVEEFLRNKFKIPDAEINILIEGTLKLMKLQGLINDKGEIIDEKESVGEEICP